MPKKKRTLSPEHLAKLQAGRARAKQLKKGEVSWASVMAKPDVQEPRGDEVVLPIKLALDLTNQNIVNEQDLIERIRRMFDQGEMPNVLRVNSTQLLDILDLSQRYEDFRYFSPFGEVEVNVIPAKDIHESF